LEQNVCMSRYRSAAAIVLLASSAALLWGGPCRAALGGDALSVAADQSALRGDLSSIETPRYRIREISTGGGIRVHEYADAGGTIFAVTWNGPAIPDLRQLLGGYYGEYTAALLNRKPVGIHRSISVAGQSVRVELSGHMRAYSGRAYLPARIPAAVQIQEIR
jgi:Protein of unknown function (DUF2844)